MATFHLRSKFKPSGDQPAAIGNLMNGLSKGAKHQTLLGATGTGKTFTMANVIAMHGRPTLILAHNKTLAAQLYSEFKSFFPYNSVEYFVSYYDYYQPEAYVARRDLYIEKDSSINEAIEKYRNAATQALLTRDDVIIVASVSCIYGLGNPEDYLALSTEIKVGESLQRSKLVRRLVDMQYERSDFEFHSGNFRVRGDIIDINLAAEELAVRIEYFGDEVDQIKLINPISGEVRESVKSYQIFPAKQFVTPEIKLKKSIPIIRTDMENEVKAFQKAGRDVEAMRLRQRVNFDLEMLEETGYTKGIENYSRYVENRPEGSAPSTLLDYFPDDWLIFVDESHMTVPQVSGMYNGDKARKTNLVNYGFRLKAALDNRPLKFEEFEQKIHRAVYVSATPSEYEISKSISNTTKKNLKRVQTDVKSVDNIESAATKRLNLQADIYNGITDQIIRPTGLLDPIIDIRPVFAEEFHNLKKDLIKNDYSQTDIQILKNDDYSLGQVKDLIKETKEVVKKGYRVLVTTLTKKMSEELAAFLKDEGIRTRYIHSDIDSIERIEILRDLRLGEYDVLVGINLLREGLDLPEVALVAILDADKEGFLRSQTSLIQTIGRAARHEQGRVILYADKITKSIKAAVDETLRRRKIQKEYNKQNGITPSTIVKEISTQFVEDIDNKNAKDSDSNRLEQSIFDKADGFKAMNKKEQKEFFKELDFQMQLLSDMLEFEKAAQVRDLIKRLKGD